MIKLIAVVETTTPSTTAPPSSTVFTTTTQTPTFCTKQDLMSNPDLIPSKNIVAISGIDESTLENVRNGGTDTAVSPA